LRILTQSIIASTFHVLIYGLYMLARMKVEIRTIGHMELEALEVAPNPATNATMTPRVNCT